LIKYVKNILMSKRHWFSWSLSDV